MQEFKIEDAGDGACKIHQRTNSGSTYLSIPLPKATLVAGMIAILTDGDLREHFVETVMLTKNTTNVTAHVGSASFTVPLTHIAQLVL